MVDHIRHHFDAKAKANKKDHTVFEDNIRVKQDFVRFIDKIYSECLKKGNASENFNSRLISLQVSSEEYTYKVSSYNYNDKKWEWTIVPSGDKDIAGYPYTGTNAHTGNKTYGFQLILKPIGKDIYVISFPPA